MYHVKFKIHVALNMKTSLPGHGTVCFDKDLPKYRGTPCLHFYSCNLKMRQHVPPKCWWISSKIHPSGITPQKAMIFINISNYLFFMFYKA